MKIWTNLKLKNLLIPPKQLQEENYYFHFKKLFVYLEKINQKSSKNISKKIKILKQSQTNNTKLIWLQLEWQDIPTQERVQQLILFVIKSLLVQLPNPEKLSISKLFFQMKNLCFVIVQDWFFLTQPQQEEKWFVMVCYLLIK